MPNKTIYVSDGDQAIYQRAQELAGGNLSAAIVQALRRYVDVAEARDEGFDEIVVRVGPGAGRKVRFSGALLGEWANSSANRYEVFRVYRSRTGKYVVHTERTMAWEALNAEGKPAGWRGYLGVGNVSYKTTPAESRLDVVDSVEAVRDLVPPQLFEVVARAADQPLIEDLDI